MWFSPFPQLTPQSVSKTAYLVQGIAEVYGKDEDEVTALLGRDGLGGAAQGSLGSGGSSGDARDARLGQVSGSAWFAAGKIAARPNPCKLILSSL